MSLFEINNFNINQNSEKQEVTQFQKYELIIKARNFHYENYNKWMSYFYIMIAALFVAYYNVENKLEIDSSLDVINRIKVYTLGISSLGVVLSFLWYLANKGYYYWNINFITLVNHYEKNILNFSEDERVYFVSANKKSEDIPYSPFRGANFSTSRISIFISYVFTYTWCLILNYNISSFIDTNSNHFCVYFFIFASPIVYILVLTKIFSKYFKSYNKHFPDLKIETLESNNYSSEKRYTT